MSKKNVTKNVLLVSALTLGITGCAMSAKTADVAKMLKSGKIKAKKVSSFPDTVKNPMPGEVIVKCAGIAKKGQNHCGANGHSCNGLSAKDPAIKDFDKNEWIYVREDVCNATPGKIVGKKLVVKG